MNNSIQNIKIIETQHNKFTQQTSKLMQWLATFKMSCTWHYISHTKAKHKVANQTQCTMYRVRALTLIMIHTPHTVLLKHSVMLVSVALLSHVLLEFRIVSTAPVNPRLIPLVRQELWNAITEVSSFYQHTQEVKWRYGFYCPHSIVSGGRPHPALCQTTDEPQDVVCSLPDCHEGPIALEDRHKCWFTVSIQQLHKIIAASVVIISFTCLQEVLINTDSHRDVKVELKAPTDKWACILYNL